MKTGDLVYDCLLDEHGLVIEATASFCDILYADGQIGTGHLISSVDCSQEIVVVYESR